VRHAGCHTSTEALLRERLSSAPKPSYTPVITRVQDGPEIGLPGPSTSPADHPAALSFADAAELCGHDTRTREGAADARHDFRVWDLVDLSA
jgi:hypothetical protein